MGVHVLIAYGQVFAQMRVACRLASRFLGLEAITRQVICKWYQGYLRETACQVQQELQRTKRAVVLCGSICYSVVMEPDEPSAIIV